MASYDGQLARLWNNLGPDVVVVVRDNWMLTSLFAGSFAGLAKLQTEFVKHFRTDQQRVPTHPRKDLTHQGVERHRTDSFRRGRLRKAEALQRPGHRAETRGGEDDASLFLSPGLGEWQHSRGRGIGRSLGASDGPCDEWPRGGERTGRHGRSRLSLVSVGQIGAGPSECHSSYRCTRALRHCEVRRYAEPQQDVGTRCCTGWPRISSADLAARSSARRRSIMAGRRTRACPSPGHCRHSTA